MQIKISESEYKIMKMIIKNKYQQVIQTKHNMYFLALMKDVSVLVVDEHSLPDNQFMNRYHINIYFKDTDILKQWWIT